MKCKDMMKTKVEKVMPNIAVAAAAAVMRDKNVGFLPVCDEKGLVLGTLTDRDVAVRVVADSRPPSTSVRDVMTQEVVQCSPDDDIDDAVNLMAEHKKSRIMCVDAKGVLVGVISLSDLAQRGPSERTSDLLRDVAEREARA